MRLIGPNCIGLVNTDPAVRLQATFGGAGHQGHIGLAVQSGGVAVALTTALNRLGLGVSTAVSTGDALDAMLTSSHGAVVVTGGRGEYRGVASFQQVMEHIRQVQEQAAALSERVDGEADASSTVVANTSSTTDFDAQADEGEQR